MPFHKVKQHFLNCDLQIFNYLCIMNLKMLVLCSFFVSLTIYYLYRQFLLYLQERLCRFEQVYAYSQNHVGVRLTYNVAKQKLCVLKDSLSCSCSDKLRVQMTDSSKHDHERGGESTILQYTKYKMVRLTSQALDACVYAHD